MNNRFFILIFALAFTAASCNSLLFGGSGAAGVYRSEDFGDTFKEANNISKKTNLGSTSVNSLIFDPADSQVMYLGSSSGIYKSTDAGGTWKLFVTNILVTDLAVDPYDSNILYAVGVVDSHAKVVKTSDGGSSWQDKYTEPTTKNSVMSVAVDPKDHLHVLIGLKTGEIIHSRDGGTTWQVLANLDDQISRIRYGPNSNPYVLTLRQGLFESKDGKTFDKLTASLTGGVFNYDSTFSAVTQFLDWTFDRSQTGVIYLATEQGLVRTVNDGGSWSYMQMPVRNSVLRTSSVAVSPKDSNNLYATVGSTLFKSINGGVTWQTKPLPSAQEVRTILIDPSSPNVLYLGLGARK